MGLASPKYRRAKLALTMAVRYARSAVEIGSARASKSRPAIRRRAQRREEARRDRAAVDDAVRSARRSVEVDRHATCSSCRRPAGAWPAMAALVDARRICCTAVQQLAARSSRHQRPCIRCSMCRPGTSGGDLLSNTGSLLVQARDRLQKQSGADQKDQRECDLADDEHAAETDAARSARATARGAPSMSETLPGLQDAGAHAAQSRRSRC